MPSVTATIEVPLRKSLVYRYLRDRYDSDRYRSACMATKGYVPPIAIIEDVENIRLRLRVPGRDSLFRFAVSSWRWTYELHSTNDDHTQVTIEYTWSWLLSVLSLWTARDQAANELVETVMAIEAIHYGRT